MRRYRITTLAAAVVMAASVAACSSSSKSGTESHTTSTVPSADALLEVTGNRPVATLDDRFASYNVEMVTVVGGSFWAPYGSDKSKAERPPIDLSSARLRNLAKALGPAYIRVSGTWANATYFDPTGKPGEAAPEGFSSVLTGDQWRGVGSFADAVDGEIVTSYPSSPGAFDANGVWKPDEAKKRLAFDKANHIPVVAAELFNEANLPVNMPTGYTAADYTRDFGTLAEVAQREDPGLKLVGPSATNDVQQMVVPTTMTAEDMARGVGPQLDAFSYHFYPKMSQRCGGKGTPALGLEASYLDEIDSTRDFYTSLRDRYAPKAPMWVTETAQASCGGDPWSADFVDVIRLVDTFGKLSDSSGNVVFHNTLVGSDYAYLSEDGFATHPDYFAAVLWHRLMGPKVLTPGASKSKDVTVYAQCTPGSKNAGATYTLINTSPDAARTVRPATATKTTVYQLTGKSLDSPTVELNGKTLAANDDGTLPAMTGRPSAAASPIELPPASVTFIVDPTRVPACQ